MSPEPPQSHLPFPIDACFAFEPAAFAHFNVEVEQIKRGAVQNG
jgi:hypothetical protein